MIMDPSTSFLIKPAAFLCAGGFVVGICWLVARRMLIRLLIVAAAVIALAIAARFLRGAETVPGSSLWIFLLLLGVLGTGAATAGVLHGILSQGANRRRQIVQIFASGLLLACSLVTMPSATAHLQTTVDAAGVHPRSANEQEALVITQGLPLAFADNFTLVAVDGRFTRQPTHRQPIHELATYMFGRNLSPALEPGRRVAGAMAARFTPEISTLRISSLPIEGVAGRPFTVQGDIEFSFRSMQLPARDGNKAREWSDHAKVSCRGVLSDVDASIVLHDLVINDTK